MQISEKEIRSLYEGLTKTLIQRGMTVTTMESCTSGLIASLITDTEGASAVLKGAFITYSNEAKIRQGVPKAVIDQYGVYSPQTAWEMAKASREAFQADIGIGVTGTFGNLDPANPDSQAGHVWLALAAKDVRQSEALILDPEPARYAYKLSAAWRAGLMLKSYLDGKNPAAK